MRITQVTTRTGDLGTTRLVGGQEVPKHDPRVEAYGTVDELNAVLGLARTFCAPSGAASQAVARVDGILHRVQNQLFQLGGWLATLPTDRWEGMPSIGARDVLLLEQYVESLNRELPPLQEFVLPGGGAVSAFLHQARTVCRRAERRVTFLHAEGLETGLEPVHYLNRLSDLLFVLARWAARNMGDGERTWDRTSSGS